MRSLFAAPLSPDVAQNGHRATSELSPLCARERTSQKGKTLSPSHRPKLDKLKFRAGRAFDLGTLLPSDPASRELRTA
jgi:hypothetical protein